MERRRKRAAGSSWTNGRMFGLDNPEKMNAIRLSRNLRLSREQLSMPQEELAIKAGLSISALKNIEMARSSPKITTMVALSSALGVTVEFLLTPIEHIEKIKSAELQTREGCVSDS